MATTYTPVLRLAKPTTGELSGTWGDVVNDNITSMLEQAVSGKATVAMADANQTLTTANGTTDQARCMMVECTGALAADRNVVCPTATKLYIVNNLTSGGKNLVFKTTAGTGVTVPPSTCTLVYCDGTNVVSAIPAAALLGVAQTWTAVQTFTNSDIKLLGSSTGATTFTSANAGASNYTLTIPAVTDTLAVLGANTFTGAQIYSDQQVSRQMLLDCGNVVVDKGNISNATVTFDYTAGSVQTFTATGSTVTWAFSNWPPTGNLGILEVIATNAGAFTQALTGVTWTIPAGTTTTSLATFLAANGTRTALQASGVDRFLFQTRDAGATIFGSLLS